MKRPTDSNVEAEMIVAVDKYGETVTRFWLFGVQQSPDDPEDVRRVKLAHAEVHTGPGEVANLRPLLGPIVGIPQHQCPHCGTVIEAMPGDLDQMIADEDRILRDRTGMSPEAAPLISGPDAVAALRGRKLN